MIEELKSKTQPVSKEQVWSAWKRIKQGGKGVGVDNVTIEMIERNPRKYLYPLWNRLASGSYFPPPVKEVLIPKGKVKTRILGVPTILDKVAQEVIRVELEKTVEPLFHPSSFGYRPGKSAHDAVEQCAKNCWERWYVVDLDIKGFFDNIDKRHGFYHTIVFILFHKFLKGVHGKQYIRIFKGIFSFKINHDLHIPGAAHMIVNNAVSIS